jgi:hypothetical protein
MHSRRALLLLAMLVLPASALQERAPGVRRVVYEVEVDLSRAWKLGWAKEESDEQLLAGAERIVRRRLAAMERSFQLSTDLERRRIELSMPQIQPRDRESFADMLASIGQCEFLFLADAELGAAAGIDLEMEEKRLETWRAANPGSPLELFHALEPSQAGPHRRVLWVETAFASESGSILPGPPQALLLPDQPEDHIGSGCFASSHLALDSYGYPAIGFELHPARAADFARVTEAHFNHRMGIVLGGKLRSAPTLQAKLIGGGIIEGRFTPEEAARLGQSLTELAGPLRVIETR